MAKPKNEKIVVERVHRDVIAKKLLASLDDTASVAIIVNVQDLDMLINVFYRGCAAMIRGGESVCSKEEDFHKDLKRLRREAFG